VLATTGRRDADEDTGGQVLSLLRDCNLSTTTARKARPETTVSRRILNTEQRGLLYERRPQKAPRHLFSPRIGCISSARSIKSQATHSSFFFIVRRRNRNCLRSEVEIRIEGGRELLILRVRGAQQELTLRTCSLLSILHPADRSFLLATTYVCYLLSIIYSPSCRSILLASYYVRLLPALYYLFSILQIDLSC
jgi:hypothetical protein